MNLREQEGCIWWSSEVFSNHNHSVKRTRFLSCLWCYCNLSLLSVIMKGRGNNSLPFPWFLYSKIVNYNIERITSDVWKLISLSFPPASLAYTLLQPANLNSVCNSVTAGIFTLKNTHFPFIIIFSAESGGKSKLSSISGCFLWTDVKILGDIVKSIQFM